MKALTDRPLTGDDELDKILVFKPNLFDPYDKHVQEKVALEGTFFYKYLKMCYDYKTFQFVMENIYAEDLTDLLAELSKKTLPRREAKKTNGFQKYKDGLLYILDGSKFYDEEEKYFIEDLIQTNSRTEDIVDALLKDQLIHDYRLDYVDLLCRYTRDKELLKPLVKSSDYYIRKTLIENKLFLRDFLKDLDPELRQLAQEKVKSP